MSMLIFSQGYEDDGRSLSWLGSWSMLLVKVWEELIAHLIVEENKNKLDGCPKESEQCAVC